MRNKTNKLRRLESSRYSIMTNDLSVCYFCKNRASDIHEVYGGRNRKQSMRYGFCLPMCRRCHIEIERDVEWDFAVKVKMQEFYEKENSREEFMKIIGRNYIGL